MTSRRVCPYIVVGAFSVALVPAVVLPVNAQADDMSDVKTRLETWGDQVSVAYNDAMLMYLSDRSNANLEYLYMYSEMMACKNALYNVVDAYPNNTPSIKLVSGYAYYDGYPHLVTVHEYNSYIENTYIYCEANAVPVVSSDLFTLGIECVPPTGYHTIFLSSVQYGSNSYTVRYWTGSQYPTNTVFDRVFCTSDFFTDVSFTSLGIHPISIYISDYQDTGVVNYTPYRGNPVCGDSGSVWTPSIYNGSSLSPRRILGTIYSGDTVVPPVTLASTDSSDFDAIIVDIHDSIETVYPNIDTVWIAPDSPPEPSQYATDDIIPGIPKDWTIINPQLPTAPSFNLPVPEYDASVLNPSATLTEYTAPIGFWFWLLESTVDSMHLKPILLAALAFGLLVYILWCLGR